jgi:hypothetical protein
MNVEIWTKSRVELSGSFFSCHAEHIEFIDGSNDFNILILQIFPESWERAKISMLSGVLLLHSLQLLGESTFN